MILYNTQLVKSPKKNEKFVKIETLMEMRWDYKVQMEQYCMVLQNNKKSDTRKLQYTS